MSNRELAAYLIIALLVAAILAGWRVARSRERKERRRANAKIDLAAQPRSRGGPDNVDITSL